MGSAPERIGDYLLGRRIAVGGMAEIFEARALGTADDSPPVVVKVLLPQYARDPEVVRMLEHEAVLQERLEHPGLLRVLEHGQAEGRAYIVMEHVDGVSLSELMATPENQKSQKSQAPPLPRDLALYVLHEVGAALAFVHDAKDEAGAPLGIVHRDVTPQNVLISRTGQVLLGDFGIARSSLRDARTRTGVIKGKLRYVAPEQVTGSAIDRRTDLYGLGVMAFEVLTGEPYLRGETEIELLREAESPTARRIADHADAVDPRLDRLVARLLSRFPEERPPTAKAFLDELACVRGEADEESSSRKLGDRVDEIAPAAPVRDTRTDAGRSASSRRPWIITVSALAALAVAWTGSILLEEPPTERRAVTPTSTIDAGATGFVGPPDAATIRGDGNESPTEIASEVANGPPSAEGSTEHTSPSAGIDRTAAGPVRRTMRQPPIEAPTESDAPASVNEVRRDAGRASLQRIRTRLRQRGMRTGDLDPVLREALARAERALDEGRLDDADAALMVAGPAADGAVVDAAFVQRKVRRVDAAIHRADRAGSDTARAQRLSATALSDFMAGRHAAANRRLNEILDALAAAQ